ncbi:hypothetical protein OF83DRAFT_1064773 [Amylostereum chailletii]|nr:hypothetical protein OF83DRAFT_1064773 [Amylostereum chailletii]
MYGRHRHSIADIEESLNNIFLEHPDHYENARGDLVIPADCLPDVFGAYREHSGIELLAEDEMRKMIDLLERTQGLEATPHMLLQLVATRSNGSPDEHDSPEEESPYGDWDRGRDDDRTRGSHSRSSSAGSNGTYYPGSRPPSRPPSRGANVPPSPFDAQKRQRTTPLGAVAPSSWTKRPVAPSRRKSDAGSHSRNVSDSESSSAPPPTSFSRSTGGRRRTSSNSQDFSGVGLSPDASFEIASPPNERTYSRPHSRAQSQPQNSYNMYESGSNSPPSHSKSPAHLDLSRSVYDAFHNQVSSLPMPRATDDDDSDGDDDSALGLVLDRSAASSTISMEPNERLDVLQKANVELTKKLMESERTLQIKLADHEQELEDMEMKLEEVRAELTSAKREEKELRSKERSNSQQISILESEVQKLQKQYEQSRTAYTNLQKQYQEQLSQSEDLRNTLRRKDDEIQETRNSHSLMELEQSKWMREHDAYEERIAFLEHEIAVAQQTQMTLDDQKHENLMLKETIDRMRFDMDELRNGLTSNTAANGTSQPSSISKSLGAELAGQLQGQPWQSESSASTALEELEIENIEESDGEDVIQTIITRKKRRGLSRANAMEPLTILDEREYADAYTQYDPAPFHSTSTTQTDPEPKILTASFSVQTEAPKTCSMDIQTDPEEVPPPRVTVEMEVQTDAVEEPVLSRSPSPPPEEEESMASSSSTVLPPTPRANTIDLLAIPPESPPSYNTATSLSHHIEQLLNATDPSFSNLTDPQQRREYIAAAEVIKSHHPGLHIPMHTVPGGISEENAEDWRMLKEEVGVGCLVIDKVIERGTSVSRKDGGPGARRRGRFYNIYNTYVYGGGGEGAPNGFPASQLIMAMAASAVVFVAMSPFLTQPYAVPGGPTYYDRAAWSSFNTMHAAGEGFSNDGTAAVWNFLGRLGGGAARVVRNWPT